MKKTVLGILILLMLCICFQHTFAQEYYCGTNVKYTVSDYSMTFSRADSSSDAVWGNCGEIFKSSRKYRIINITDTIRVENVSGLFSNYQYVREMNLANLDISAITDMSSMFLSCSALETLNLSGWNVSGVTDMSYMFANCSSLTSLDLSSWNVSGVQTMQQMFMNCSSLTTLNLSGWTVPALKNAKGMFYGCSSLTALDVSKWNTASVTDMSYLFAGCNALSSLDVSKWNTGSVISMSYMFYNCVSLTSLDVSKWTTSSARSMAYMFSGCKLLKTLDVSKWNTASVTNMSYLFAFCSSLTGPDVSKWNTANVTNMGYMFTDCNKITSLDVSKWNTSAVTNMQYMFNECDSLTSLNVSKWNTANVTNMQYMFYDCNVLKTLDVSKWNTSAVIYMSRMFANCNSLKTLDVSKWNTSAAIGLDYVFKGCSSLTALDVSKWDVSKSTNIGGMFYECSSLTELDLGRWNTSGAMYMWYMFFGCTSLDSLDLTGWDPSNARYIDGMFTNCNALANLTLGQNTLKKNIFTTLPKYNDIWYYTAHGESASDPLALNTAKADASLFTGYDYSTMAGIWSAITLPAESVKIYDPSNSDVTGKTVTISSSKSIKLKAVASPSNAAQKFTWKSSDTGTASVDASGKVTFRKEGTVTVTAMAAGSSGKSAWVKITFSISEPGMLTIEVNNIRGYTNGITVKFKPVTNATGYKYAIYDHETGKDITASVKITLEKDSTGSYKVLRFYGTVLENGHPYRIRIRPINEVEGIVKNGTAVIVYGAPNPRITAITAAPGNKSAVFRTVKHAAADGFRYNVYAEGSSARTAYYDVSLSSGSLVRTASGLTNGKLYYVTAIPYTLINGTKYWGASMYRIYFVPLSAPAGTKVTFSGTKATVSMTADSAVTGIKVLYRVPGGSLVNGCEASGSKCTVKGLNKNNAYEFYIMKYKTINGKNHYSPGVTYSYKTDASGLPAPENPLIAKRGSDTLSFTIVKNSKAAGISVLCREEEGAFTLVCETNAATCTSGGFSWDKTYSFYIMQYKTVSGKKVYSPGITVTNWLAPKTADLSGDGTLEGLVFSEDEAPEDLYAVLEDYYTEEDLIREEAMTLLGEDELTAKAFPESDEEIDFGEELYTPEEAAAAEAAQQETDEVSAAPAQETGTGFTMYLLEDREEQNQSVPSF